MLKMPILLVHGGSSQHKIPLLKERFACMHHALEVAYEELLQSNAIDAVVSAIAILEDSGMFNAGKGSIPQANGIIRMDASIMDGKTLRAGAVINVPGIANPILASKFIMEKTNHIALEGDFAKKFALSFGLKPYDVVKKEEAEYLLRSNEKIKRLYHQIFASETVGAVALDKDGNVAAGASTGGCGAMLPGRVGDTPFIGCGVYADNKVGAVSSTGIGETIIRVVFAYDIIVNMKRGSMPKEAIDLALQRISKIGGRAGAIAIRKDGKYGASHNSMFLLYGVNDNGKIQLFNRSI